MRAVLGLAVVGGLFLLFWFTFPVRASEQSQRVRRWFLVTAFLALGAAVVSLVVAFGWQLVNGA
jgi:hypothetical protein